MNKLGKCKKCSKAYYFAVDPNILESNASPIHVATKKHHDLKNLYQWLEANNLFFNFGKTKFIIFRPC